MAEDTKAQYAKTRYAKDEDAESGDTEDVDDLDAMADRLEAALDRIARCLDAPEPMGRAREIAVRLDGLIERLRDVLGTPRNGNVAG